MRSAPPGRLVIRDATLADCAAIRTLLNQAVRETTAVWYDTERTPDMIAAWYEARVAAGFPILVAEETGDGRGGTGSAEGGRAGSTVRGYASYGPFRPHDGFAHTAEHSIYVAPHAQGRGIGSALLAALAARAGAQGLHILVGALEAGNTASLALHARHGFIETGRMPEVGRKFGRWLTLVWVQKLLADPD